MNPRGGFIRPVETKVQLATISGGLSTVTLTPLVLWLLGAGVFGGPWSAFEVDQALLAVPWPVTGFVTAAIVSSATFVGGWYGKHTARPDLDHARADAPT